jgi:hypothetical protein
MEEMMPMRRDRYPENWEEIVAAVRRRSGNRCEGSPRYPDCRAVNGQPHPVTGSIVVLTTAHLNHQPADGRLSVLAHLCQRCHLTFDARHHADNRRRTLAKRLAVDQRELPYLFEVIEQGE